MLCAHINLNDTLILKEIVDDDDDSNYISQ